MEFLTSGFNVLLIILGFGVLIFVHELGHFIAAKWAGIRTEAFAVGMGPVALAWRKGIGLRFRSTAPDYEKKVREHVQQHGGHVNVQNSNERNDALPQAEMYRIGDKIGLGETEYSLRWLPIGGFVKMLGQEDANPNYVSNDPRSYTMCPVGKRMIVVSAGVIMNIVLAMILFIIAFMVGVHAPAPVVGDVAPGMPAASTLPRQANQLGIQTPGLQPGDEVIEIDGNPARTFADLQIASAMSKPGVPIELKVNRAGFDQPLTFTLQPERDEQSGLLGIGIYPGASTTLVAEDELDLLPSVLQRMELDVAGVKPGMRLLSVNGEAVSTLGQVQRAADASNGQPLSTVWSSVDSNGQALGEPVTAVLRTSPDYEQYQQRQAYSDPGLLGLSPLIRIAKVRPESPNSEVLREGDVIVRIGSIDFPRRSQLLQALQDKRRGSIDVSVLRDGRRHDLLAKVNKDGQLVVEIDLAEDVLITAQPLEALDGEPRAGQERPAIERTPIAQANLMSTGGTRVLALNDQTVETWPQLRNALRHATSAAHQAGDPAEIRLLIEHPNASQDQAQITLRLTTEHVSRLHALGWRIDLPQFIFEPIQVTLHAQGNPLKAIGMGLAETRKVVVVTYLTIDRLFRGSVGVEQLRGPVGIIHIGAKVADRGFMYIVFFLGMISVNLAVINFLPIPIVDGGLFLFLVYEKLKGRPPSLAFQNAATLVGLCLIGTLFIVTFYNDVLRLFS